MRKYKKVKKERKPRPTISSETLLVTRFPNCYRVTGTMEVDVRILRDKRSDWAFHCEDMKWFVKEVSDMLMMGTMHEKLS